MKKYWQNYLICLISVGAAGLSLHTHNFLDALFFAINGFVMYDLGKHSEALDKAQAKLDAFTVIAAHVAANDIWNRFQGPGAICLGTKEEQIEWIAEAIREEFSL